MKRKNYNNNFSLDNPSFEHEIADNDLKEMQFEDEKKQKKLFIIIIIIIFLGLLLIGFGIYYSTRGNGNNWHNGGNNDLFVVHSKPNFGDEIKNVCNYTSYDNSFLYTFYVENQNKYNLWYKVIVQDSYNSSNKSTKFDKEKINYAVIKNDEIMFKGVLGKDKDTVVASAKLFSKNVDNYKLKFWTDSKTNCGYYKFVIRVEI